MKITIKDFLLSVSEYVKLAQNCLARLDHIQKCLLDNKPVKAYKEIELLKNDIYKIWTWLDISNKDINESEVKQ